MRAAVHLAAGFDTVANNAAEAVLTPRCQPLNGAFKAVKGVRPVAHNHGEGLVVIVSTGFALGHATRCVVREAAGKSADFPPGLRNLAAASAMWVVRLSRRHI